MESQLLLVDNLSVSFNRLLLAIKKRRLPRRRCLCAVGKNN